LRFALLGPLEVRANGSLLPLTAAKQKAILASLLLRAGEVVSTDQLIEALWPESPPANALTALQGYVLQLRRLLEPEAGKGDYRVLVTKPPGYELAIGLEQLDVRRFEQLFREGTELLEAGSAAKAAQRLREALELWHGSPLADFRYDSFAQPAIVRLEDQRLACLEERIAAEIALGRTAELGTELEALHAEHPLRERLAAQRMLTLYRSGRQADALDVYQRTRERLVEELGIEPSVDLRTLYKAILNHDEALAASKPDEPAAGDVVKVPAPVTPLIGRERELREALSLVSNPDIRLVTITGPGGVGKTRLTLAVAGAARSVFPDGVVWVALQAIRDPLLVIPTIAHEVDATSDLSGAIGERRLLLVLDNLEHLLPSGTELAKLLSNCPNLTLLATSREPLHLSGEHRYPLGPLADDEAAALFTVRARAARPEFMADADVPAICERLDNLPLAVELAAAWTASLTSAQILQRLERRLPLLTGGPRDAPARQSTLKSTIEWSYELLSETDQRLFGQLAVFAGSFALSAAEEICDASLDALHSLADKSLIQRSGERFSMLETIREFGIERLDGDAAQTPRRHAEYFVRLAEEAEEGWFGSERSSWIIRLEAEQANLRAALTYLESRGDHEGVLRLIGAVRYFWTMRGAWAEGKRSVEPALHHTRAQPTRVRAKALGAAGNFALPLGELDAARSYAEESLALFREVGEPVDIGRSLGGLGAKLAGLGELGRARDLFEEAAVQLREGGDKFSLALVVGNLGDLSLRDGDYARAEALFEEALALHRQLDHEHGVPTALYNLAFLHFRTGHSERARSIANESLLASQLIGDPRFAILSVSLLGSLATREGNAERGGQLLAAAEAERVRVGLAFDGTPEGDLHLETIEELRRVLGSDRFAALLEQSRSAPFEEAVSAATREPAPASQSCQEMR